MIFSRPGLHLAVKYATQTEVAVIIYWNAVGRNNNSAAPEWQSSGRDLAKLPTTVVAGSKVVLLRRPTTKLLLAANYDGRSDVIVISPLPSPPAFRPTQIIDTSETYRSPMVRGWGKNFSNPYVLCTPDKPAGWTIKQVVDFHLEGTDKRACDHYATCGGAEADTPKRVCRSITVQGYEDGTNAGNAQALGVLTVIWSHSVTIDAASFGSMLTHYQKALDLNAPVPDLLNDFKKK